MRVTTRFLTGIYVYRQELHKLKYKVIYIYIIIYNTVIFEQVECTLHLFKAQPGDGPIICPKHVAGIII